MARALAGGLGLRLPAGEVVSAVPLSSHSRIRIRAAMYDHDSKSRRRSIVDENMRVLRQRIREMKMAEMEVAAERRDWMDWERKAFEMYKGKVCHAIGILQLLALEHRPSVALATAGASMLFLFLSVFATVHHTLGALHLLS